MERLSITPRENWEQRLAAIGFEFHSIGGQPYWTEDACYRFSGEQIDELETATQALHDMSLELVERVVERGDCERLGLNLYASALVEQSWRAGERALYGRMDLSYDGRQPPKLLEYNADTPTALFEASVVQWFWLQDQRSGRDQFNSIHEKLVKAWNEIRLASPRVHFASVHEALEDRVTCEYLRDTCVQAGFETVALDIADVGWNGRAFTDLDERPIAQLFKLYPWEWLLIESFGAHLHKAPTRWIEPAWKMLLSNKAVLPLLWEWFPNHPNLLPASNSPDTLSGPLVRKPRLGREGEDTQIFESRLLIPKQDGDRMGDWIYQRLHELPDFGGRRPVIGSWIIGNEAAGIGIREDDGPITRNTSRFVPHTF